MSDRHTPLKETVAMIDDVDNSIAAICSQLNAALKLRAELNPAPFDAHKGVSVADLPMPSLGTHELISKLMVWDDMRCRAAERRKFSDAPGVVIFDPSTGRILPRLAVVK